MQVLQTPLGIQAPLLGHSGVGILRFSRSWIVPLATAAQFHLRVHRGLPTTTLPTSFFPDWDATEAPQVSQRSSVSHLAHHSEPEQKAISSSVSDAELDAELMASPSVSEVKLSVTPPAEAWDAAPPIDAEQSLPIGGVEPGATLQAPLSNAVSPTINEPKDAFNISQIEPNRSQQSLGAASQNSTDDDAKPTQKRKPRTSKKPTPSQKPPTPRKARQVAEVQPVQSRQILTEPPSEVHLGSSERTVPAVVPEITDPQTHPIETRPSIAHGNTADLPESFSLEVQQIDREAAPEEQVLSSVTEFSSEAPLILIEEQRSNPDYLEVANRLTFAPQPLNPRELQSESPPELGRGDGSDYSPHASESSSKQVQGSFEADHSEPIATDLSVTTDTQKRTRRSPKKSKKSIEETTVGISEQTPEVTATIEDIKPTQTETSPQPAQSRHQIQEDSAASLSDLETPAILQPRQKKNSKRKQRKYPKEKLPSASTPTTETVGWVEQSETQQSQESGSVTLQIPEPTMDEVVGGHPEFLAKRLFPSVNQDTLTSFFDSGEFSSIADSLNREKFRTGCNAL
jgi:hypothetical protein